MIKELTIKFILASAQAFCLLMSLVSLTAARTITTEQQGPWSIMLTPVFILLFCFLGFLHRKEKPAWRTVMIAFLMPAGMFLGVFLFSHGVPQQIGEVLGFVFVFSSAGSLGLFFYYIGTAFLTTFARN